MGIPDSSQHCLATRVCADAKDAIAEIYRKRPPHHADDYELDKDSFRFLIQHATGKNVFVCLNDSGSEKNCLIDIALCGYLRRSLENAVEPVEAYLGKFSLFTGRLKRLCTEHKIAIFDLVFADKAETLNEAIRKNLENPKGVLTSLYEALERLEMRYELLYLKILEEKYV